MIRRDVREAAGGTPAASFSRLALLVLGALVLIVVMGVGGLALGSRPTSLAEVWAALTHYDPHNTAHLTVVGSRIPRSVLAVIVGAALGLAGLLMQAITGNPLAEPGLFGVNAGAAAAVVAAITVFHVVDVEGYVWFAFVGSALAATAVYALGSAHRGGANPARMALAGAAVTVAVSALTDFTVLSQPAVFEGFRFWAVGSLQGRSLHVAWLVLPFVVVGIVATLLLIRPLNALALGDDMARGLGSRPWLTRGVAAIAVVLLAGAATAAAGPISFVGLAAPHLVRLIVGSDQRALVPGVLVVGPAFVLLSDVLGRWIIAPAEIQTAIAAALLGGPVFVALVRSRRLVSR